jgi:hypothetical protein
MLKVFLTYFINGYSIKLVFSLHYKSNLKCLIIIMGINKFITSSLRGSVLFDLVIHCDRRCLSFIHTKQFY